MKREKGAIRILRFMNNVIKWRTQQKKYALPNAQKKRVKKALVDASCPLGYLNSKIIPHFFFQDGKNWISWILGRHIMCRVWTISDSTQTFSSDTLGDSTSRFDPFFCRIVGVLTVVNFSELQAASPQSYSPTPIHQWINGAYVYVRSVS